MRLKTAGASEILREKCLLRERERPLLSALAGGRARCCRRQRMECRPCLRAQLGAAPPGSRLTCGQNARAEAWASQTEMRVATVFSGTRTAWAFEIIIAPDCPVLPKAVPL